MRRFHFTSEGEYHEANDVRQFLFLYLRWIRFPCQMRLFAIEFQFQREQRASFHGDFRAVALQTRGNQASPVRGAARSAASEL